jgi:hypothetical protein
MDLACGLEHLKALLGKLLPETLGFSNCGLQRAVLEWKSGGDRNAAASFAPAENYESATDLLTLALTPFFFPWFRHQYFSFDVAVPPIKPSMR